MEDFECVPQHTAWSQEEHRMRHQTLYEALDELLADYMLHNKKRKPVNQMTVYELLQWSYTQTKTPTSVNESYQYLPADKVEV